VLGQLTRAVSYRDKETFMSLYTTYVRPHLEYAVQAWCPWTLGDNEILENVQRRAVAMVTNLRGRTYGERLAEMGMTTLENRRRRGGLIQMFRVMAGKDRVEPSTWFSPAQNRERAMSTRLTSGSFNVERKLGKSEVRKNFWSVRVVDSVKSSASVDIFKNSIDNLMAGGRI
jgi:ribonuclease P/MRP protein subunit RPP40